jgi:hypothetical protein
LLILTEMMAMSDPWTQLGTVLISKSKEKWISWRKEERSCLEILKGIKGSYRIHLIRSGIIKRLSLSALGSRRSNWRQRPMVIGEGQRSGLYLTNASKVVSAHKNIWTCKEIQSIHDSFNAQIWGSTTLARNLKP